MVGLNSLSTKEVAGLVFVVGLFSAKILSADELNVVGNLVVGIGGLMLTIAAHEQFLEARAKPSIDKTIEELQQQVKELNQIVETLTGDAVK